MKYILSLGTNQGNKFENLEAACEELLNLSVDGDLVCSRVYETEPYDMYEDTENFFNQVVVLDSDIQPMDFLRETKIIEIELGREAKTDENKTYVDRVIDIDLLACDEMDIQMEHLTLPHPEMANRNFVLIPLVEVMPDWIHPILKKTAQQLLDDCMDTRTVFTVEEPGDDNKDSLLIT